MVVNQGGKFALPALHLVLVKSVQCTATFLEICCNCIKFVLYRYGFVTFSTEEEAARVYSKVNGVILQ